MNMNLKANRSMHVSVGMSTSMNINIKFFKVVGINIFRKK